MKKTSERNLYNLSFWGEKRENGDVIVKAGVEAPNNITVKYVMHANKKRITEILLNQDKDEKYIEKEYSFIVKKIVNDILSDGKEGDDELWDL